MQLSHDRQGAFQFEFFIYIVHPLHNVSNGRARDSEVTPRIYYWRDWIFYIWKTLKVFLFVPSYFQPGQ